MPARAAFLLNCPVDLLHHGVDGVAGVVLQRVPLRPQEHAARHHRLALQPRHHVLLDAIPGRRQVG